MLDSDQKKFDLVRFWGLGRFSCEGALAKLRYLKELKERGIKILHGAFPR